MRYGVTADYMTARMQLANVLPGEEAGSADPVSRNEEIRSPATPFQLVRDVPVCTQRSVIERQEYWCVEFTPPVWRLQLPSRWPAPRQRPCAPEIARC